MRIGYYIPGWPPGLVPNGIVTTLGNLGAQLQAMGHEITYVTPFSKGNPQDGNVIILKPSERRSLMEILKVKWSFETEFYAAFSNKIAGSVEALVQRNGIELFHMEETQGWAATVIRRVKIPVVVQLAGPWFIHRDLSPTAANKPENRHRIKREGEAIRNAAALRAASESVLSLTEEYYGPLKALARVIPNPIAVKPAGSRWTLDTCDHDRILFVGRFDFHKGADLLLMAFAKLALTSPNLRLDFVGHDAGLMLDDGSKINFVEFVERTISPALRERLQFHGPLSRSEIDRLRIQAYLTIVPSRYETFGNTVIEAMATGCPIVATNVGGISEILVNDVNGLTVAANDIDELVAAITKLLGNPSLAARLGEQAVRDCAIRFEPATIAQRHIDFYADVITHHNESTMNTG